MFVDGLYVLGVKDVDDGLGADLLLHQRTMLCQNIKTVGIDS